MTTPAKQIRNPNTKRQSGDVAHLARLAREADAKLALAVALDDESEFDWDTVHRVGHLLRLVQAHAQPGSAVAKAFSLYGAHHKQNWNMNTDFEMGNKLAGEAWVEWLKLSAAERAFIGEGWHAPKEYPTLAEAAVDDAACCSGVMWALCADAGGIEHVDLYGRFAVDEENLALVQLKVRQWGPKAETIKAVRDIADALEARWDEAVGMDETGGIGVRPQAGTRIGGATGGLQAAKVPELLPVGTLIEDKDQNASGIIVGAFKGESQILYIYVRPDGEVDSQFSMGVEPSAHNCGGLPVVKDIHGGDPLVKFRADTSDGRALELMVKALASEEVCRAGAVHLAVDMKGRPIGTKKKPRSDLKTTRKLDGGEGKSRAEAAAQ